MDNNIQYGTITEQGDLFQGFNPLNEKENQIYNEAVAAHNNDNQQPINEDKK